MRTSESQAASEVKERLQKPDVPRDRNLRDF